MGNRTHLTSVDRSDLGTVGRPSGFEALRTYAVGGSVAAHALADPTPGFCLRQIDRIDIRNVELFDPEKIERLQNKQVGINSLHKGSLYAVSMCDD